MYPNPSQAFHSDWVSREETSPEELAAMARQARTFGYRPEFRVALIVSDADEIWIKKSLDSALAGIYPYLGVRVCDVASERPHVGEVLAEYAAADGRVTVERLKKKGDPAAAYNAAYSGAEGEFIVLMDAGDELAPDALFRVAEFLQNVRADVVYTDEDRIDAGGDRLDPAFKPYWSPELALSAAYTGRLCAVRKTLLDAVGGFREGFGGAGEHDLMLRLSERTRRIHHLPGVLYHRRTLPGRSEPAGGGSLRRAVEEALARRGEKADVEPAPSGGSVRVRRRLAGRPGVSAIVSAPEGTGAVPVLAELKHKTSYPVRQVIVADSGGDRDYPGAERISHPFPARALNLAAERAEGRFLLFVDSAIRVGAPGWLAELLVHARRPGVGTVGCRVQHPNGGLRHGGSLPELGRLTGEEERPGDGLSSLAHLPFNPLAASAACMMVAKEKFDAAGGFDDENLPTAFYDLDLSLRLREGGLTNIYTPHASVVRGGDGPAPGEEELRYMWRRWWGELARLLYYRWPPYLQQRDAYAQTPGLFST